MSFWKKSSKVMKKGLVWCIKSFNGKGSHTIVCRKFHEKIMLAKIIKMMLAKVMKYTMISWKKRIQSVVCPSKSEALNTATVYFKYPGSESKGNIKDPGCSCCTFIFNPAQYCQFTKTSERIFKAVDRLKWYKNLGNKDGIKELS